MLRRVLFKPTPLWFSLFRMFALIGACAFLAFSGNFKPVGQEVAKAVSSASALMDHIRKMEAARTNASCAKTDFDDGSSATHQPSGEKK